MFTCRCAPDGKERFIQSYIHSLHRSARQERLQDEKKKKNITGGTNRQDWGKRMLMVATPRRSDWETDQQHHVGSTTKDICPYSLKKRKYVGRRANRHTTMLKTTFLSTRLSHKLISLSHFFFLYK